MEETSVKVSEGVGYHQLCVIVISGELVQELIINIIYQSGSAMGKILMYSYTFGSI